MKLIVLHLSDLHFIYDNIDFRVENIVKSLNIFDNREYILILFSGDMTNKNSGYKYTKDFIRRIKEEIRSAYREVKDIEILLVPGNHDLNIKNFSRKESAEKYKQAEKDYYLSEMSEVVSSELIKLDNFYNFANEFDCFVEEKLVDVRKVRFGKKEVIINLINTTLFSTVDKNDDDNGLHYLQSYEIAKLNNDSSVPSITVMHHPIEWFGEVCQEDLKKEILDNSDFLLLGHRHKVNGVKISRDDKDNTIILASGAINNDKTNGSEYYAFSLDLDNYTYDIYNFEMDLVDGLYLHRSFKKGKINLKNRYFNRGLKSEFEKEFYSDDLLNDFVPSIHELFTFPDLRVSDELGSNGLIKSINDFDVQLEKSNVVYIQGRSSSGKTTLAKKLFEHFSKEKVVIYFDAYNKVRDKNLEGKIKSLIVEQFGENNSIQLFEQEPKRNKMLIIDNFHKVKSDKYWISYLLSKFSKVIIFSSKENNIDIMHAIDTNIKLEIGIAKIEILPFLKRKREELIRKTCEYIYENYSIDAYKDFKSITNYISNQIQSFSFSPYLIVMYTRNYGIPGAQGKRPTKIFSHVFEMNIVQKLNINSLESDDTLGPDQLIWLLSLLAYESYSIEEYPFTLKTINNVISRFEEEYGNNVSVRKFIDKVVESKIIIEVEANVFSFISSTYYSYFIAKELKKEFVEGEYDVLNHIYDNLLVSINSEILLFFIYLIDNNNKLLEAILDRAINFMKGWVPLTLKPCNIKYICTLSKYKLMDKPNEEDVEKHIDSIENDEEQVSNKNFAIVQKNIFEPETTKELNELLYTTLTGLKHVNLVSNILPDFFFSMKKPLKEKFTKNLYALPNMLLHKIFSYMDNDFENEFINAVKETKARYPYKSEEEIRDSLKTFIQSTSETLILKIYQVSTQGVISNNSMEWFLGMGDSKKATDKLIMSIAASYTNRTKVFAPYLMSLMDDNENVVIVNVARSIAYEYFLRENSKTIKNEIMALHDKTFNLEGKIKSLPKR